MRKMKQPIYIYTRLYRSTQQPCLFPVFVCKPSTPDFPLDTDGFGLPT
jgi:hypothetical protein